MKTTTVAVVCVLVSLVVPPVAAADFADPTWPCIQRKVEQLSPGLMWSQEIPEGDLPDGVAAEAEELVDTLVLRRVTLEQASMMIDGFVAAHPDLGDGDLGRMFADVFTRIDRERTRLIAGISRYSLTQIDVAARIDSARNAMEEEMARDDPDYDRVDVLEEQLDWDQRIYTDRAQALTYVCETPVILEKRAYGIAQALSAHLDG